MTELNHSEQFEAFQKRQHRIKSKQLEKELKALEKKFRRIYEPRGIKIIVSIADVTSLDDFRGKGIGYARFSSKLQREGFSIPAQISKIIAASKQDGVTLAGVCIDIAKSAYKNRERDGLNALFTIARGTEVEKIYVHKLDRLSRDLDFSIELIKEFGQDSRIRFIDLDIDLSTPEGKLIFVLKAAMAENYSENLATETRKGRLEGVENGYHNGAPPFGYVSMPEGGNSTRKIGTPIPEYRDIVRQVFERYATGIYSFRDLARWLNDQGIKNSRGENFRKASIRDMLKNPYYNGKVVYRGKDIKNNPERTEDVVIHNGRHEAIIDDELWEKCQRVRRKKAIKPKTSHPTSRVYFLNGIIFCSACGRRLRAHTYKREYMYYREVSELRGKTCKNNGKGVSATEIDSQIETFINQLSLPENWEQQISEEMENSPRKDIASEIDRLRIKQRRLTELYPIAAENDIYRIRADLIEVKEKIELLEVRLSEIFEEPGDNIISIQKSWQKATTGEKRDLVRLVINRVMCDVAERKILWIEPKPEYKVLFMYCWPDKVDETGKYWF